MKTLFIIVYYEKLKEVRYQDVYHEELVYCLGISDGTGRNIYSIYDFKTGCVKTECLHEGWQTSGSLKVVKMAYNHDLYAMFGGRDLWGSQEKQHKRKPVEEKNTARNTMRI